MRTCGTTWGVHGANVVQMAQAFGVNTDAAGITAYPFMEDQAGIALGQASLTVGEQATMLATLDDNGIYHDAHVITSIRRTTRRQRRSRSPATRCSAPIRRSTPKRPHRCSGRCPRTPTLRHGADAGLSNGQEIVAKTGTTNTAQSAFFIGAIPSQALAVGLFTNEQGSPVFTNGIQTLDNLGGIFQGGGDGGTWPAAIWHTYAEDEFVPLGIEQFTTPVTGSTWNLVPPGLRNVAKKHRHDHGQNGFQNGQNGNQNGQNGNQNGQNGFQNGQNGNQNGQNGRDELERPAGRGS